MNKLLPLLGLFLMAASCLQAQKKSTEMDIKSPPQTFKGERSTGYFIGDIAPLRESSPEQPVPQRTGKAFEKKNYFSHNQHVNAAALPGQEGDALAKKANGGGESRGNGTSVIPGKNFEGLRDPDVFPPDPTGDIGRDHYMQATNNFSGSSYGSWIQIWNKDGESVLGPFSSFSKFWNQLGIGSIGDPIIQYDHDAQRWIFMEMHEVFVNTLLIAISNTSDPTGSWKAYRFQTNGFPDYPKLYVWPDAYYVGVNEIVDGNVCSGYALERKALLAGDENFGIFRFEMPKYTNIIYQPGTGVDWEGGAAPPPGSPGLFMRLYDDSWDNGGDQDHLQIWRIYLDWNNEALNRLEGPEKIYVTPFESTVCWDYFLECVEQPTPGSPRISAQDQIIMYRVPYRNYGSHESLVLTHISDVSGQVGKGGDAATRWYELRRPAGSQNWVKYQEGTYAPDGVNRFMGTICHDLTGNIGMAYSVCDDKSTFPGLRVTGHRTGNPLGEMSAEEYSIIEGGKSHESFRWGDYSTLAVDPVDGRTFWFTGEYQPSDFAWGTRIFNFTLRRDTHDIRPKALVEPVASAFLGSAETVTMQVFNEGLEPAENVSVTLKVDGVFVATETVAASIPPGQSVPHTFAAKVDLSIPGRTYNFDLITSYGLDQYALNDSIRTTVRKLTSNDAAIGGRLELNGIVCASEHDFRFILKNAAGVPLTSARVSWRINGNPWESYDWTGNLQPDGRDTFPLSLKNMKNGLNLLTMFTELPNGQTDQDRSNDTLKLKITGVLAGSPTLIIATSQTGSLNWTLRELGNNTIFATGDVRTSFDLPVTLCLPDERCYRLTLKSNSSEWTGRFELYDLFDSLLVKRDFITGTEVIDFCITARKAADVGALQLVSPKTAPDLKTAEKITVSFRNFGETAQTNVPIRYRFEGSPWREEILTGTLQPGETQNHTFSTTEDLSQLGKAYQFDIETRLSADELVANDAIHPVVFNRPPRDLGIAKISYDRVCSDTSDIVVSFLVRNNGSSTIDSFNVDVFVNGNRIIEDDPYFVTLSPQAETEVLVPLAVPGFGDHNVRVELTSINGLGGDFIPANDSASVNLKVAPGGFPVYLLLDLDGKSFETSWELLDEQGNVILAEGPYQVEDDFLTRTFCLEPGKCYTFRLHDSGDDGMQGFAYLSTTEGVIWGFIGEDFGSVLDAKFCTDLKCANFNATAEIKNAAGPNVPNGRVTIHATGGTRPYFYKKDSGNFLADSVFNSLKPGVYHFSVTDSAQFCFFEFDAQVKVVSAAGEASFTRSPEVTPNPTNGISMVKIPALPGEQEAYCQIFDEKGKFLFGIRMARWDDELRGVFALDKYPPGTYFLRIVGLERNFARTVVRQ